MFVSLKRSALTLFTFHNRALKNIRPQHLKVILVAIISIIILYGLMQLLTIPFNKVMMALQMSMMTGQSNSQIPMIATFILIYLIIFVLFALIAYPLLSGIIFAINQAINNEKVKITNVFSAFKKGRYGKAVLLGLITLLFLIPWSILNSLIDALHRYIMSHLLQSMFGPATQSASPSWQEITVQLVDHIIIALIYSIVTWFFLVLIINYTVSYIKQPAIGVWQHIKNGFKAIKNGHKTWFKFFLGILLLNLIIIIVSKPLQLLISLGFSSGISQNVAYFVSIAYTIITSIIKFIVLYWIISGIVQYYNRNGEPIKGKNDKTKREPHHTQTDITNNKNNKNLKDKASHVKNDVTTTRSNVDNKSEEVRDNINSKTSHVKDKIDKNDK